jgi:hypothetical protein
VAIGSVAAKLGVAADTVRTRVRREQVDTGLLHQDYPFIASAR